MKCKCKEPVWYIEHIRKITCGKNCGKEEFLMECLNCGCHWKTLNSPLHNKDVKFVERLK